MSADESSAAAKRAIRQRCLDDRARRRRSEQVEAGTSICARVLLLPEAAAAATVGGYVSFAGEPGTGPLVEALHDAHITVLLPLLRDDFDLDWARYRPRRWRPGRFGLTEPAGPALGVGAIEAASLVVCPGVAGDAAGRRLGRGGGSYDRVLSRLPETALRCLLLYDAEVLSVVPADPHDQPVDVIVTPTRTIRCAPA